MSLKNIPTNWCVTTIGDINDYKSLTFNPKSYQEDSFELYSVPSFASGSPEILLGKDIASNKQYIQFKDILLCKINPRINRVWCVKEKKEHPQIGSSEWIVIRQPLIHEGFLAYFLQTQDFRDLLCSDVSGVGGSLTRAQPKRVATYNVPIAPLPEQKIIAEKLDTLLAQVDSTKVRLEQIPQILKRFRQAVLGAAVSGNLTEAWRRKNNFNFDNWENLTLGHIVKKIEAGKNLKCIEIPPDNHQYGIIKISAVTWGEYDEEESKTLPDNSLFIESRRISVGDFLISRANTLELLGNPVIVKQVTKNLMLSDKVLRLVMEDYDKPWINIFLRSFYGRREIEFRSTGNQLSMRNIGQKALLEIPIPKPPIEEQAEIVRRVEQLFAYADAIEKQVNNALARVNNLTQSILAKAFRGELTAQWRAENPDLISGENSAAALLEKIKAERAASGGKKASRKKS
ncbi:restriction endonuclease subunit S [Escherichia marmotae]|uniref:restriction endonuclease subunit S n=1 Tax=Escherichia marmotae TaxID=1499973 RepID=UPI00243390F4|nr:restriction endonuclease subunit S [Escherichia marmotae]MED9091785.1 restriction endonuclease subunit S [Escherichia marmotae]WFZ13727.1 restriction endonuclease subunit S [Escherichia marmotae]